MQAGSVGAVVGWHVDRRLTRSPRELEDVIDLADKHGLELATVTGEVDLSNPTGRLVARMLGAAARHEAEHKAERQKRQRRQAGRGSCPDRSGRHPRVRRWPAPCAAPRSSGTPWVSGLGARWSGAWQGGFGRCSTVRSG